MEFIPPLNGLIEWLLSMASSITVISAGVVALLKWTKWKDRFKKIETHVFENYMSTLRLTVRDETASMEERLEAGRKYIQLGGNGAIKVKYKMLLKEFEKQERNVKND